ncbi:MAG: universal stress protein [Rubripirellula sp.]
MNLRLKIARICVPTDFSAAADHAVHYAAALARSFGADMHLLHVIEHAAPRSTTQTSPVTARSLDRISISLKKVLSTPSCNWRLPAIYQTSLICTGS